ncbi:uncharacterized protein LOC133185975 [Saccostrea echinata]|uniref:uncharacterized protein LOC133185975 n=1 Tax=Saccostrea echinata TaxID=191078 RepID=UPI002A8390D8|nr:uncharacterized protein LOC133185975 [Saccostrea echinata]
MILREFAIFICILTGFPSTKARYIPSVLVNVKGEMPTAKIVINVIRKRAKYWDFWQVNSHICPPSLCFMRENKRVKPRGTGDSAFYNGDIVLDEKAADMMYGPVGRRRKRATTRMKDRLWKDGIMYYQFAPSLSRSARKAAKRAMEHISNKTCIVFKKKRKKNPDFVRFISEPGCWSNVGRVGGLQNLSLGYGCEKVGTAVHEINHALGFWHEQARSDRDKYVEVNEDNISPNYLGDFEKLNKTLAVSRGYAYDYSSIMHYSERTFTNNGLKTIKVIGIGKELALRIGQREALSNIDIAQLRDMYFCNRKQDNDETICPKDWIKHKRSCYRFLRRPKLQYAAAHKECKQSFSTLVHINTANEDRFLKQYLKKNFKKSIRWRTGARRINDTFEWDNGEDRKTKPMTFTAWNGRPPEGFSTMVLGRENATSDFAWEGAWTGSVSQLPDHTFSIICERKARRKCLPLEFEDGRDYRGELKHTLSGITCQKWTSKYPQRHSLLAGITADVNPDGLGDHNSCRNPFRMRRKRPWCFTTKKNVEWEYCDVTVCKGSQNNTVNNKVNSKNSISENFEEYSNSISED